VTEPHVLIVGAGSAGKRHARNLRTLGARVSLVDSRPDRLDEARTEGDTVSVFGDLETALANSRFDGFVIATPPSLHVSQILRITREERPWILCEKPLGLTASEAQALQHLNDRILLGYTYRWWPPIQRFRERLLNGDIGRIRGLRFVMSAHLADWHPWERYQGFFMADRALGGGALLDESHFIDLMLWMHPGPDKVYAQVEKVSDLEISADDNVEAVISYPDGVRVNMHLDLIGRPHQRTITAIGERGTLVYSYEENALRIGLSAENRWEREEFHCERNDMFIGVAGDFLSLVRGEVKPPACSVEDGTRALEIVDACRRSSLMAAAVALSK
jgi:predicted dehydrogenase